MAKTLVALYDTLTDAERVVQELIDDGFARSDVHLVFDHTKNHTAHASSVARDSAYEEAHLLIRSQTSASRMTRPPPMRRGSVAAVPSWWSRVAMTGRSVAWRS